MAVKANRLPSGYWMVRGKGPCEWAQPPSWPCDEATLRSHIFPEASESFVKSCIELADKEAREAAPAAQHNTTTKGNK